MDASLDEEETETSSFLNTLAGEELEKGKNVKTKNRRLVNT